MAQHIRFDEPGAWLHTMNRGVARRTVFETRADYRYFLACMARAARAGWFEIHAYCLIGTHFHHLLRSLRGQAWRGLRLAQNLYARRFNMQRRRDGPLFRGRFRSKRVWSEEYWCTLVRYIDNNAPSAGLVSCASQWPFGSAHHYAQQIGPPWLTRSAIEGMVTGGGREPFTADGYDRVFGQPLTPTQARLVELRVEACGETRDPFDDLVGSTPAGVLAWMHRKAALADGTTPGVAVLTADILEDAMATHGPRTAPGAPVDRELQCHWMALRAGLLRACCGAKYREIGQRLECSVAGAHRRVRSCGAIVQARHPLVADAAAALTEAVRKQWPQTTHRTEQFDVLGLRG